MARIYYSFLLPKGYIQVISQAQGKFLISQLSTLPASAKIHIRFEIYKTIKVPRELSLVCIDSGKHNVFYDCATNAVTMVDFELMQPVEPELVSPHLPEIHAIFSSSKDSPLGRIRECLLVARALPRSILVGFRLEGFTF